MLRIVLLVAAAAVAAALPTAAASGVGGPAFYVDGVAYRTVALRRTCPGRGRRPSRSTRSTTSAACSR